MIWYTVIIREASGAEVPGAFCVLSRFTGGAGNSVGFNNFCAGSRFPAWRPPFRRRGRMGWTTEAAKEDG